MLGGALREVEATLALVENTLELVKRELALLENDRILIHPLDPVPSEYWVALRTDPPESLLAEADGIAAIQEVARLSVMVGEMIRSREAYRTANRSMNKFLEQLRSYDALRQRFLRELADALDNLRPILLRAHLRVGG